MIIKVKEQDLMGIIESINRANGDVITDTLFLSSQETVVEHVCGLLGLSYADDYENYRKIVLENKRNIKVEVEEKDIISIIDSINEGCNDGTIVDTLFYNDGVQEEGIGGTTLLEHLCFNILNIPLDYIEAYKEILKLRGEL